MRLTRDEIILIAFIVLSLLLGTAVKHYRQKARMELKTTPTVQTPAPQTPEE
jgi:hypothetical protein